MKRRRTFFYVLLAAASSFGTLASAFSAAPPKLPLEYLQLGDGLDTPEGIALIKDMPTLRSLTLTNAKALTDADLKLVAGITQLEHLELGGINLPDERLASLKDFAFLKSMRLVPSSNPFTPDTQGKIQQLLTKTELQFK